MPAATTGTPFTEAILMSDNRTTSNGRRPAQTVEGLSAVAAVPAAAPDVAAAHFGRLLEVETDCADVGAAMAAAGGGTPLDFVLLDVRGAEAFAAGHVDGAT